MCEHFTMNINIEIDPANREEFLLLVAYMGKQISEFKGNIEFKFLEDRNSPNHFVIWEIWESEEIFQKHTQSEYFQQYMPKIGRLFKSFKTMELNQVL